MRRKLGNICMVLGAALVIAALSLFLWNRQEGRQAGAAARRILPQVVEKVKAAAADETVYPDPYTTEMTEEEIDGYSYIGYLSIPAIDLELPVMSDWDYVRLKIAPGRYCGSAKTDDLVIAGHNYAEFFGTLKDLSVGDQVYFADMDGVLSVYTVAEIAILTPYDVEEMTGSGYALTLFTCTFDGQDRVTVRCDRAD